MKYRMRIEQCSVYAAIMLLAACATTPPAPEPESDPTPPQFVEPEPVVVEESMIVFEPEPEPEPEPMQPQLLTYTVVAGDNLWDIADKSYIYGNAYQWPLIYKDNKPQISDADLIYPGQIFNINLDHDSDEVNAAIEHATMRGSWSLDLIEPPDLLYLSR